MYCEICIVDPPPKPWSGNEATLVLVPRLNVVSFPDLLGTRCGHVFVLHTVHVLTSTAQLNQ